MMSLVRQMMIPMRSPTNYYMIQCYMMYPRGCPMSTVNERRLLDVESYQVPFDVSDVVCFGDDLIRGATRCVPLQTWCNIRLVAASEDTLSSGI